MTIQHLKLGRLRKRAEFLFVADKSFGQYAARPGLVIQMRKNETRDLGIHVGFTATKRIGNAVIRNRSKRRLREIARAVLPELGRAGHDYVFIARDKTPVMDWNELKKDAEKALIKLK